jgi:hypothetical protein
VRLLPLTPTLSDLFRREKVGHPAVAQELSAPEWIEAREFRNRV